MSGTENIPAGYRTAERMDESLFPFICESCGATVARTATEQHSEWHRWLWDNLGMRAST